MAISVDSLFAILTPEQWGILGVVAAIFVAVLEMTLRVFSRLWRAVFPAKPQPVPFYVVPNPEPPRPEPAPLPQIRCGAMPIIGQVVQGRKKELQALRDGLQTTGEAAIVNAGAVVQGLGGIGKTTLAAHYVDRFGADYGGIVWAVANDPGQLAEALLALAPQLGVDIGNLAPNTAAQAVLMACAQDRRDWLFVYDNVEDFADIQPFIPQTAHLIVTTRAAGGWDGFACVRADVLGYDTEDAAAVRLLMQTAGRDDDAGAARDLAAALGGLPLALVVAGALIRAERDGFAAYQSRIADVIAQVPRNAAYPDSVIGAVKLSYDRLPDDAQRLVDVLAWWAPEGLTPDLLTGAPDGAQWAAHKNDLPEGLIALVADQARVRAAFQALVDASLVTRAGRADGDHALHRMTGAALRALQGDAAAATAATALLAAVYPYDSDVSSEFPLCRHLTPHVRALWTTGAAPRNMAMGYLLNQAGLFLRIVGDHAGGLTLAEAGFVVTRALHESAHPLYAVGLHNLGTARLQAGDAPGALQDMRQALKLQKAHRPGTEDLAVSYDQLGVILERMARAGQAQHLPEAIRTTQRALALRRHLHGRQSEPVALSLNNLAVARHTQGRRAAAARLSAASLNIRRKVLPAGDARLAYGALNTGWNLLEAGAADRAEPLLQEALEIRRAAFVAEPDHPELRIAAGWLISCLLVRAAAAENRKAKTAAARNLCAEFGLDWQERLETVNRYPYTPRA